MTEYMGQESNTQSRCKEEKMGKEKSKVDKIKLEEGMVSFVVSQKHIMKQDELKLRYKSLSKTLQALTEEKEKIEEIAKKLNVKLD